MLLSHYAYAAWAPSIASTAPPFCVFASVLWPAARKSIKTKLICRRIGRLFVFWLRAWAWARGLRNSCENWNETLECQGTSHRHWHTSTSTHTPTGCGRGGKFRPKTLWNHLKSYLHFKLLRFTRRQVVLCPCDVQNICRQVDRAHKGLAGVPPRPGTDPP